MAQDVAFGRDAEADDSAKLAEAILILVAVLRLMLNLPTETKQ